MSEFSEIKAIAVETNKAVESFIERHTARLDAIENELIKSTSPGGGPISIKAVSSPNQMKAFNDYARKGVESGTELKAMSSGSDPNGGYTLPTQIESGIYKYLRAISPMRRLARTVTMSGPQYQQIASDGGTGYSWVGETSDRPETDTPTLRMLTMQAREVYAMPKITQNLLDDNDFNLEQWLIDELSECFGDGEADAFINGNGVTRPRGLFTYDTVNTADATRAHDKFQYIATGASGGLASTDPVDALIKLVYAVKARYRTNASWLISPELLEAIRKLKNPTTDDYIFQPSIQLGQPDTLLGYPIAEDENIPAIAANSLSAAFGDFSRAYTIADRSTSMLRDPYTSKPYVNFYSTKRVAGGGGRDMRAVKFLKFAAS